MFRKRPRTSSTLLAWTVVKTRCPVSAELMAICAVSVSRISPTMILSGSWRKIDRRPRAKVKAAILWDPLPGDVELRHGLDARDDRAVELPCDRPHRFLQHAVDPILHVDGVVLRLDVDVARAALDGGVDRRVDEPDDRAR